MRYLTDGMVLWEVVDEAPTSFTVSDVCDPGKVPRRRVVSKGASGLRAVRRATNADTDAWLAERRAALQELEACVAAT